MMNDGSLLVIFDKIQHLFLLNESINDNKMIIWLLSFHQLRKFILMTYTTFSLLVVGLMLGHKEIFLSECRIENILVHFSLHYSI